MPDALPLFSPSPRRRHKFALRRTDAHTRRPPSFSNMLSTSTAGVRGTITRFVTTINSASSTYHFYELDVVDLDQEWLESKERKRVWVDYAEALRRLQWKAELAQGLALSSFAPRR